MEVTFKRSRCSQPHAHLCLPLLLARLLSTPATPRPGLTRRRPRALAYPGSPMLHPHLTFRGKWQRCTPASHTDIRPHARPDAHLPCAQMHCVGKDADAHEQAAQVGKAHKSAAKRGDRRGEGHRSIKMRRGSCPRIRLSPLLGSARPRRRSRSRIGSESNDETAGSDALHIASILHDTGRRAHWLGNGRSGQPWYSTRRLRVHRSMKEMPARTRPETKSTGRQRTLCVR